MLQRRCCGGGAAEALTNVLLVAFQGYYFHTDNPYRDWPNAFTEGQERAREGDLNTAVLLLDNWGYGVDLAPTNDLWKTVHDLFLRYCDKQYKCLPPV